ncbi:MAG: serine hydrolase domain-containing protein, partial [Candidatus Bathyarchaeia archaeon]
DPLRNYLPSYPNVDSDITIRQLLNHTSGLYHWVEHPQAPTRIPYNSIDFEKWWTTEEIFDKLIKEPYFPPGKGWHYTQTGYILGTLIVEQITRSKVSMEIQKRLLDPLNINGMLLDLTEPIPSHFKIAHNWVDTDRDGILEDVSSRSRNWINSLSRILFYTRAEDLARWSHALYHGEVLSQASLGEMLSFHSPCPGEPLVAGYGLGVMKFSRDSIQGEQVWGHIGSTPGYRAFLGYLPKHDVSMSVLINSDCSDEVCGRLINALLKIIVNHLNSSRREEISL